MYVSLRTCTDTPRTCIQTFRAKFIAPACRFSVNVVALTDMRVSLILIETLLKYARFPVSLKLPDRVFGRLDELFDSAELFESVRRVGVTTSGVVKWSPSTENCRSSQKLTSGRPAVDETRRERATRGVAVAVVGSPSAVPRRRLRRSRCRRPWPSRGRTDDKAESTTALTPGSTANRSAPAAAVVCCCRSCCRVCVV